MIPLRDLERRPGIQLATALLVFVNVAVWVYVLTLIDRPAALSDFYERWAFRPPAFFAMLNGGPTAEASLPLFTHQFLHGGWLHIAGNMVFLWVFGGAVESKVGHVGFLIFYVLAGCAAALTQGVYQLAAAEPNGLVGASGAISGVLGAYIVLAPRARVRALVPLGLFMTPIALPAILLLGEWFVLQLIAAFNLFPLLGERSARIAYFAHIGGFVAGAAFFGAARIAGRVRRMRPQPVSA